MNCFPGILPTHSSPSPKQPDTLWVLPGTSRSVHLKISGHFANRSLSQIHTPAVVQEGKTTRLPIIFPSRREDDRAEGHNQERRNASCPSGHELGFSGSLRRKRGKRDNHPCCDGGQRRDVQHCMHGEPGEFMKQTGGGSMDQSVDTEIIQRIACRVALSVRWPATQHVAPNPKKGTQGCIGPVETIRQAEHLEILTTIG